MTALPTIPTFTQGESGATNLTNLQELSNAVSFLARLDVRPTFKMYKTGTLSLTAGAWTNPNYGKNGYDSDGIVSTGTGSQVTIKTQGYYALEGCAQVVSGTTATLFQVAFLFTAGANNPHYTTGTTKRFGQRAANTASSTSGANSALCAADLCPVVLYAGDTLQFSVQTQSALTLQNNANGAYNAGRFVCLFTGYWLRTGT